MIPMLHCHANRRGRMRMQAISVSSSVDEMRHRHNAVLPPGDICVMVSVNSAGLAEVDRFHVNGIRSKFRVPDAIKLHH